MLPQNDSFSIVQKKVCLSWDSNLHGKKSTYWANIVSTLFNFVPHVYITNRGAARGGLGGPEPPRNLEDRLPKPIQNINSVYTLVK